jgi:hypothetical protein
MPASTVYKMQDVVAQARIPINDAKDATGSDAACRFLDATLLGFANHGVLLLRQKRADLFFGQFEGLPAPGGLGDFVPVADEYFPALVDYVVARAETPDDESVDEGRALAFFKLFGEQIAGT